MEKYKKVPSGKLRYTFSISLDEEMKDFVHAIKEEINVHEYMRDQLRQLKLSFDEEKRAG